MTRRLAVIFGAIAATSVAAQPGPPPPRPDLPATAAAQEQQQKLFEQWKRQVPSGSGPFGTIRYETSGLPDHTIFRPARAAREPMPIVAFANGGCRNTPIEFSAFLAELASRNYLVIAAGTDDVPFATTDFSVVTPGGKPVQKNGVNVLTDAVDWAVAENERKGSPLFHKIRTGKVAYMGQSCGGLQAISASLDPRTTTTVVLNSGQFAPRLDLPPSVAKSLPPRVKWSDLHGPVAFFTGGPSDVAHPNAEQNVAEITNLPVFWAELPVGHTGAYPGPDMRWVKAVSGWLAWQLKGDKAAARLFTGSNCELCVDPAWTVGSRKMLDKAGG